MNRTFMIVCEYTLYKMCRYDDTLAHDTLRILPCRIILILISCKGLKSNRKPQNTLTDNKVLKIATLVLN